MEYPKKIMSITELTLLGFSREQLNRAVHAKHACKYAHKMSGRGQSKWQIDTEMYEKYRRSIG